MNSGGCDRSLTKFFRGRVPSATAWAMLAAGTTYLRFGIAVREENSWRFLYHRFVTSVIKDEKEGWSKVDHASRTCYREVLDRFGRYV